MLLFLAIFASEIGAIFVDICDRKQEVKKSCDWIFLSLYWIKPPFNGRTYNQVDSRVFV